MRKADNLPPSCAVVTKSGNRNFLEHSGPLEACNGTDLPLFISFLPRTSLGRFKTFSYLGTSLHLELTNRAFVLCSDNVLNKSTV